MDLLLRKQRIAGRRLGGLAISAPLHLAGLLLALNGVAWHMDLRPRPADVEITYVKLPPANGAPAAGAAPTEKMLVDEGTLVTDAPLDDASLALPGFDFDITKISERRNVLFPFVTAELRFLDDLRRETGRRRARLAYPLPGGDRSSAASKPRLQMTAAVFDRTVDQSWARRDRWSRFAEIARLVEAFDPNDGRAADLVHAYRDRNILQPICDYRIVSGPPRRETIIGDHMLWVMLENAADHADFVDFVHAFAREHGATRTTTELLFIVDKLAQANRDALVKVLRLDPATLTLTASLNRNAFDLVGAIRTHYGAWLIANRLDSVAALKARYDDVRLRLLSTILDTTPEGYRAGDARFLIGEMLFEQNRIGEAVASWKAIAPASSDSYAATYLRLKEELSTSQTIDAGRLSRVLHDRQSAWRIFATERLHTFGSTCDTF